MCGIIGYFGNRRYDISSALSLLEHRGPDYSQYRVFELDDNFTVGLGHSRLAIMDLDKRANQPYEKTKGKTLVFNGEIYNFKCLKKELEGIGINFSTNSDTEVLYELLISEGEKAVEKLSGMFAFAFYDSEEGSLIVARDYLGIKPIYYTDDDFGFCFASEIKALKHLCGYRFEIADDCLQEFMQFGFLHEPRTGYKNVKKVPPGTILKIDLLKNKKPSMRQYAPHTEEASHNIREEIQAELNRQMVSDVQLGLFFSGGMDSSLLLALRPDLKAMTVRSKGKSIKSAGLVDDYAYAQSISKLLQTDLHIVELEENKDLFEEVEFLVRMIEEPIADFTGIISYKLSKIARENGFKVMLSGMGADEVYAGYPRHQFFLFARYFKLIFWIVAPILKRSTKYSKRYSRMATYYSAKSDYARYTSLFSPFTIDEQTSILRREYHDNAFVNELKKVWDNDKTSSRLSKMLSLDRIGFLSHNFIVADKSSMLSSIELRVPLATEYRFLKNIELNQYKLISFRFRKKQLRKVLLQVLPKKYVDRPKRGFHPPLDARIRSLGAEKIKSEIAKGIVGEYFVMEKVNEIIDNHFQLKENNTFKIYRLIFISKWLNINVT